MRGGADRITDFSFSDGDRIAVVGGMTHTVADDAGNAVVTFAGGGTVTLVGIVASNVQDSWFIAG